MKSAWHLALVALILGACGPAANNAGVMRRASSLRPHAPPPPLAGTPLSGDTIFAVGLGGGGALLNREPQALETLDVGMRTTTLGDMGLALTLGGLGGFEMGLRVIGGFAAQNAQTSVDPLARPEEPLVSGALAMRGFLDTEHFFVSGTVAFELHQLRAQWDFGNCFVQDAECVIFDVKGGPEDTVELGLGAQIYLGFGVKLPPDISLLAGLGMLVMPYIPTQAPTTILCDGNGRCEPERPQAPGVYVTLGASMYLGAEWRFVEWMRARLLIVPDLDFADSASHQLYLQGFLEFLL